ncbi:hypothetical protein V6N12_063720 [Hibiscus sabdariffa]|uniref:non-specific serine/threonine protein kinase n=1 Tax=Hibiscus sabdariffa TaxID=183260 RepID=A0ABR2FCM5_9ROSI
MASKSGAKVPLKQQQKSNKPEQATSECLLQSVAIAPKQVMEETSEKKRSLILDQNGSVESLTKSSVSAKVSDGTNSLAKISDRLESGKSSMCRRSTSSDVSDESTCSSYSSSINKPHKANDLRWEAIQAIRARDGILEREILQSLDHPFLPTLYTHFETEKFSCLVMEFCPGGDLHTLRQRQPGKHFPKQAVKFYVAEVLLALEYLHMLGIIYRDLKPENLLVREDGHIMLSDFYLSLCFAVSPTLVRTASLESEPSRKNPIYCVQGVFKTGPIAEPTDARSMSFVGTHECLAPEIIKGEGHGSAVDWTFGIFLYELLFSKTPFRGTGNRATLFNVVEQSLQFPESPVVIFAARDLIRGLLVKEPQHRLAYKQEATEIKQLPR